MPPSYSAITQARRDRINQRRRELAAQRRITGPREATARGRHGSEWGYELGCRDVCCREAKRLARARQREQATRDGD